MGTGMVEAGAAGRDRLLVFRIGKRMEQPRRLVAAAVAELSCGRAVRFLAAGGAHRNLVNALVSVLVRYGRPASLSAGAGRLPDPLVAELARRRGFEEGAAPGRVVVVNDVLVAPASAEEILPSPGPLPEILPVGHETRLNPHGVSTAMLRVLAKGRAVRATAAGNGIQVLLEAALETSALAGVPLAAHALAYRVGTKRETPPGERPETYAYIEALIAPSEGVPEAARMALARRLPPDDRERVRAGAAAAEPAGEVETA